MMVAYSFNRRFELAVREGWKTQTIRAGRLRHARPGELIQLFVGMRTQHCRRICDDVRCTDVMQVCISFDAEGEIDRIETDGVPVRDLDAFAVRDGFVGASDMAAFWRAQNGQRPGSTFSGYLIEWATPSTEKARQRHPATGIGE
ncbi:ASCH domain-containing protein [Tabrizicola fusiformis]|uniref:hypothetical protein n=1 Tax=Tabrizicola sp. SY72 TaxID=2741673 RepID=UPI0015725E4B|nr:hypothetical protein [Tabrizicola sp. SY72]NTT86908.1 hypothetical protein [Tabrizicola sp. SY72]